MSAGRKFHKVGAATLKARLLCCGCTRVRWRERHGCRHMSHQSALHLHNLLDVWSVLAATDCYRHRLRTHLLDSSASASSKNSSAADGRAAAAGPDECRLPVAVADDWPPPTGRRRSTLAGCGWRRRAESWRQRWIDSADDVVCSQTTGNRQCCQRQRCCRRPFIVGRRRRCRSAIENGIPASSGDLAAGTIRRGGGVERRRSGVSVDAVAGQITHWRHRKPPLVVPEVPVQAHAQFGAYARSDNRRVRAVLAAVLSAGHCRAVLRRRVQRAGRCRQRLQLARLLELVTQPGNIRHLGPQLSMLFPPTGDVRHAIALGRHRCFSGGSRTTGRRDGPSPLATSLSTPGCLGQSLARSSWGALFMFKIRKISCDNRT